MPPPTSGFSVGVDVGGTKILTVALRDGEVTETIKRSTPKSGGAAAILEAIAGQVRTIDPDGAATGIGVGMPGVVNPTRGTLAAPPNLAEWEDEPVDVRGRLTELLDQPVWVDNDVNVATLAEARLGAGADYQNLLGMFVGTGVGGGLVLDGRLRHGPRGLAGEIGHMIVVQDGAECGCGRLGHLEAYAGRASLEQRAREAHAAGTATTLVERAGEKRMKSSVWEAALLEDEDPVAQRLLAQAAHALAAAVVNVTVIVDIEAVVLGGGMANRMGDSFRQAIEDEVASTTFADMQIPVVWAALGDGSGAIGAALLPETS